MTYEDLIEPIGHLGAVAPVTHGDFARCTRSGIDGGHRPLTAGALRKLVSDPDVQVRIAHLGNGNVVRSSELRNVLSVMAAKKLVVAPVEPGDVETPTTPERIVTTTTPASVPTTTTPAEVVTTTTPAAVPTTTTPEAVPTTTTPEAVPTTTTPAGPPPPPPIDL